MGRLRIVEDVAVGCDTDVRERVEDPVASAAQGMRGVPGWLADRQGRRLRYLRLSVTDRCDLRCRYCMPEEGVPASDRADILSFDEVVRVVRVFQRFGVRTVRITGGEPLVRKNLPELVRRICVETGIQDVALTTNATAMAKLALPLAKAGVRRVNVSLDSVRAETFSEMTRGGDLRRVLAGIEAARSLFETKINAVVVRGMNDDQLREIVEWAWSKNILPRFIELMPVGEGAKLGRERVVSVFDMQVGLADLLTLGEAERRLDRGPAGYLPAADGSSRKVGFIGAVTDNFCHRCNRVRVTARGEVRACLASPDGFQFRDALRSGGNDEDVAEALEKALFGKRDGHAFHVPGTTHHFAVNMSQTGG
ncbi:MAG: GTP 3',8-cyclase MoaA [Myxococcota bacterium]